MIYRGGRVTHLLSSSRTTSEALRPSASALACTASHSSSLMRTFRSVVPRDTSAALDGLDALPAQVGHAIQCGVGVGVLEAPHVAVRAAGQFDQVSVRVAHINECTYTLGDMQTERPPTPKGGLR